MTVRRVHRAIGILMLLPFTGWAITGFVFFTKPGYTGAYELLTVKTYPLEAATTLRADASWREARYLRTVLGTHLLARTATGWKNLDPLSGRPTEPSADEIRRLLADAITANPARYGSIQRIDGLLATTDTGVEITLDWNRMSLQQYGADTGRIELLYKIHYLQWTGVKGLDKALGIAGLMLLLVLTTLGARLAFSRS